MSVKAMHELDESFLYQTCRWQMT